MKALDQKLLKKFIKQAGDQLSGDWILVGGGVLLFLGSSSRVTQDIDIVGPKEADQGQTLLLMKIAQSLGLDVGAINQSAFFFLHRIKGWEKSLVLLHEGKKARIFRPNVTLYLLLKIPRLSESDLQDCMAFLSCAREMNEAVDVRRVKKAIQEELKKTSIKEKEGRLNNLLDALP